MAERITDTKIIAQEIRDTFKKEFPKCKFSVTRDCNSISIALMSAPFDPFVEGKFEDNAQVNYHEIWMVRDEKLTDEAKEFFKKVINIFNKRNWDNSDAMTDYFDVNYYQNLEIGRWNRPFVVK